MLALLGVVVALDQVTKQVVVAHVSRGQPSEILFGFEISNVRNKGVAFGLLTGGETTVLVLTLAALALLLGYFAISATRPSLWVAVGLIAGGALGNLADRVRIGAVVDFLDPPLWPAFNLADASIVAGVALLVLVLSAPDKGQREAAAGGHLRSPRSSRNSRLSEFRTYEVFGEPKASRRYIGQREVAEGERAS